MTAAALLAVARFGVARLLNAVPLHLPRPSGRPAERRRRRHRSGAAPGAAAAGGVAGRDGLAPRRLAGSGRRDLAGAGAARPAGLLDGGAGDREPGRRGARRGVRGPGRHRCSGRGAGGRERRVRRRRADGAGAGDHQARTGAARRGAGDRRLGDRRTPRHRQLVEEDAHGRHDVSSSAPSPRPAWRSASVRLACAWACWSTCTGARPQAGTSRPGSGSPRAAAASSERIDLTVHFLGDAPATHPLGPHVRYQIHRPLFSSARLPFLSHIPDHTDLAPHNPLLTSRLRGYDVIHTTDGTFAAARTAARVSRWHGIPLTNSVHTTTPYYTRVFTAVTVERLTGAGAAVPDAPGTLRRGPRRGGPHATAARRAPPPLRVRARLARRRSGAAGRAAGARTGGAASPRASTATCSTRGGATGNGWPRRWRSRPIARLVISVGRLDPIKNVLVLAQAVRAAQRRGRKPAPALRREGPRS